MEFRNLRLYQPDGSFRTGELVLSGDRIAATPASADACDMDGLYAIPGLIDIHFHGCAGHDFGEASEQAISAMARYQAENGVCAICPATMTAPEQQLAAMMRAAAAYQTERCGAALGGVYLEGPFLAETRRGAQNGAYLQNPDADLFRRLQEEAQGLIRLCALAPELPGGLDMIEQLVGDLNEEEDGIPVEDIVQLTDNSWKIQGLTSLDDVQEALGVPLPVDEYDTFSGYIFGILGQIPEDNSQFALDAGPLHITVESVKEHRVGEALVQLAPQTVNTSAESKG